MISLTLPLNNYSNCHFFMAAHSFPSFEFFAHQVKMLFYRYNALSLPSFICHVPLSFVIYFLTKP
ncbi:hypothetical protein QWZ13_15660 [Reinekea marina]|uniref:hypothetical protein n=1 Tax=Reinekea marina TaxID=1310421 RepID=UPI0025B3603A|nr:hypothetical protein [Reinekea marina]MDN3650343.1 hypothetical protein [Reinekea marina]